MTTSVKTCFKCGAEKPLTEFYKHPQMADGHVNKCKNCNKRDVITNRESKIDYYREYDRKRGSRRTAEDTRKYRQNNKDKWSAHIAVSNALRDGNLERGLECETCKCTINLHAHHDDYSEPLNIRWLCAACHSQWHKVNGEAKRGI